MDKDSKIKAAIVIIAITLTAIVSIVFCVIHAKNVQEQKELAKQTAIPRDQITSTVNMLKGLEVPEYYPSYATITLDSSKGKTSKQKFEIIDDLDYKIATMAISDGTNTKTNIVRIEAKWHFDRTTIILTGNTDGWETIRWKSENYDLEDTLQGHPKIFTVEEAENYKFEVSAS